MVTSQPVAVAPVGAVRLGVSPRPPLGPDSLTWQLFGDHRMALLGPRAAVLQNMLPSLGQGVEDHSVWFAETLARLQRSIPPIFDTVYAADGQAAGHRVRDFHRPIKGKLPDGSPYSALNPATYYWAHATFVEHMVVATETFIRPLSAEEKDQIIAESVTWFERLVAHRTAKYGVGYTTKGWPRPRQVPAALWWLVRRPVNTFSAFVTIGGLPPRARDLLELPWDDARERRYQRFAAACRALDPLYRRLPGRFRMHPIPLRALRREGRRA